jgi:PAS domain S-box-containing protein
MNPPLARMTGSLQSRLMLSVGLLVLALMASVIFAVSHQFGRVLFRETRGRVVAVARSIGATSANALLNYDYLSLHQAADQAIREDEIAYVIVLDKEGKVAARSARSDLVSARLDEEKGAPSGLTTQAPDLVEVRDIVHDGRNLHVLDVSHGVFFEGSDVQWGTIRVGMDLDPMQGAVDRVRLILVAIGAGATLFALIGTRIISRRITASLEQLVRGTIAVSQGSLDHRIDVTGTDEIGAVAAHFNHMTAQVRRQQNEIAIAKRELEVLNSTLEDKVARRTQEFLASEEKYRTLVDSSPDPILIVQDGAIKFVNPAFGKSFGYALDGRVPSDLRAGDIFHPEDRERARFFMEHVLEGEPAEAGEIRGVARTGEVRVFELRGMRIRYLGETAVELLLMDMTERRVLQEHMLQHEKLRALGELASGVAHDFNNTLGIILGRSQLLQRMVSDEEVRRGLRTIERAAFDGGETVRRIQDFARSRTERNFEPIDLDQLLEEVVEITRTRWKDEAEVRNVKIDVALERSASLRVLGNASELREVYTNLIFNAVDAMPNGGRISIKSRAEGANVVVDVRDTGIGMDETVRARIFDPFFSTKGTKGMGLGLSVAFGIVGRHKGSINAESEPGRGTCFTIRLPIAQVRAEQGPQEIGSSEERVARILVIDDEVEITELVTDILECAGHTVRSSTSGSAALGILAAESFDMLLCDLGMREMSGWEVVKAVRTRDEMIGVVLLTGWGATLSEERVAAHGIDAVLSKPFEMKKLLDTISRILEVRDGRVSGAKA